MDIYTFSIHLVCKPLFILKCAQSFGSRTESTLAVHWSYGAKRVDSVSFWKWSVLKWLSVEAELFGVVKAWFGYLNGHKLVNLRRLVGVSQFDLTKAWSSDL